jgi:hypothetical protein
MPLEDVHLGKALRWCRSSLRTEATDQGSFEMPHEVSIPVSSVEKAILVVFAGGNRAFEFEEYEVGHSFR